MVTLDMNRVATLLYLIGLNEVIVGDVVTNEELVYLYQNGDKQALESIVVQNKGIVFKLANKYYVGKSNSMEIEDLIQEGYTGLIVAANKYDINNPSKAQFITYAVFWIRAKMNLFIYQKNTNDETSLNVPKGEDGDMELMDSIKDIDYSFENVEERIYIKQLHDELEHVMCENTSLKEREILKMHYGWDRVKPITFNEIGCIFGVTGQRIRQHEDKALKKIRQSVWGRLKAKELYNQKIAKSKYGVLEAIEKIDFAKKYLL